MGFLIHSLLACAVVVVDELVSFLGGVGDAVLDVCGTCCAGGCGF